ncbi:MAG: hypothetical protein QM731_03050 [Chitinophagaceae bacterium]
MTNSFIAIRGNHPGKAIEIFGTFNYSDTNGDKQFNNWQAFNDYLSDNYFEFAGKEIAIRGIWSGNGWTIISDPEMTDAIEEEALLELSNKLNTDVITFIIQTTSNSFGFTVYSNDNIKRHFFSSDGEITDNLNTPLPEENGLNISGSIFADDIVALANNLGIDLEGKGNSIYIVKELAYNDEMKTTPEQFTQQQPPPADKKKPWWKIW